MSAYRPKLRGKTSVHRGPWPVGDLPNDVIVRIASQIIISIALGAKDFSGDEFGDKLAFGVDGIHRDSPLGVVDVIKEDCGWSAKTVKTSGDPHQTQNVRLISGRCSVDYSVGISDSRADVNATGEAILSIWNQRVDESLNEYDDLRLIVLLRNVEAQKFTIFEEEIIRFAPANYEWQLNSRNNLQGYDKHSGSHCFTWQPHGAQFTIMKGIPGSAKRFSINKAIPRITDQHIRRMVKYDPSWIDII
jgi:hypothetical protein